MIDIPKNTYSVSADKNVERVLKYVVDELKSRDRVFVEDEIDDNTKIEDHGLYKTCKTSKAIALEVANRMIEAGYHASICHYDATGHFAWIKISKRPIGGSYSERVIG